MLTYPLRTPMRDYSGSDATKRQQVGEFNRLAEHLVAHVNRLVEKSPKDILQFEYADIARQFGGLTVEDVAEVFKLIGGGDNGLTVTKEAQS